MTFRHFRKMMNKNANSLNRDGKFGYSANKWKQRTFWSSIADAYHCKNVPVQSHDGEDKQSKGWKEKARKHCPLPRCCSHRYYKASWMVKRTYRVIGKTCFWLKVFSSDVSLGFENRTGQFSVRTFQCLSTTIDWLAPQCMCRWVAILSTRLDHLLRFACEIYDLWENALWNCFRKRFFKPVHSMWKLIVASYGCIHSIDLFNAESGEDTVFFWPFPMQCNFETLRRLFCWTSFDVEKALSDLCVTNTALTTLRSSKMIYQLGQLKSRNAFSGELHSQSPWIKIHRSFSFNTSTVLDVAHEIVGASTHFLSAAKRTSV